MFFIDIVPTYSSMKFLNRSSTGEQTRICAQRESRHLAVYALRKTYTWSSSTYNIISYLISKWKKINISKLGRCLSYARVSASTHYLSHRPLHAEHRPSPMIPTLSDRRRPIRATTKLSKLLIQVLWGRVYRTSVNVRTLFSFFF